MNYKPFKEQDKTKLFCTVTSPFVGKDEEDPFVNKIFHSHCDLSVHTRKTNEIFCSGTDNKKIIFVNTKSLGFFIKKILPNINHQFVLVAGDEDHTIPSQIDARFDSYGNRKGASGANDKSKLSYFECYNLLSKDERVIHMFSTHLDIPKNDRISPIPVGFSPYQSPRSNPDKLLDVDVDLDILKKPLVVKGGDMIRPGKQWDERRKIKKLCSNEWKGFSDYKCNGNLIQFNNEVKKYPFMFCGKGGGIEPNPKVFTSILLGVIPIVKRFVNCDILYENLPVVFIDEWKNDQVNIQKLEEWRIELSEFFYKKREKVLYRLTVDYWKEYMEKKSKTKIWK